MDSSRGEECCHVSGLITAFIGGLLSKKEESLVRNHISSCESCRRHHDEQVDQGPTE